jgi:hypothetical protein
VYFLPAPQILASVQFSENESSNLNHFIWNLKLSRLQQLTLWSFGLRYLVAWQVVRSILKEHIGSTFGVHGDSMLI